MIFRPLVSLKKGGLVPPSGLVTLRVFPLLFNEERANLVAEFWWDKKKLHGSGFALYLETVS